MRYGLVKNDEILNIIEADAAFVSQIQSEWDEIILLADSNSPGIGYKKDAQGVFKNPKRLKSPKAPDPKKNQLKNQDLNSVASFAALRPILADIIDLITKD
jgi:hypothetical protein